MTSQGTKAGSGLCEVTGYRVTGLGLSVRVQQVVFFFLYLESLQVGLAFVWLSVTMETDTG